MGAERAHIVRLGEGDRFGNIEFLAGEAETSNFTFAVLDMQPHRDGPGSHAHRDEDDSFFILEGELVFTVDGEEVVAGPGTFVLVPPGVEHDFANRGDAPARCVNVHAPGGFDRRLKSG